MDVCRAIKKDEVLGKTPVIMFTASTENLEARAKEAGAEDYLAKPFELGQLLEKVEKFIG